MQAEVWLVNAVVPAWYGSERYGAGLGRGAPGLLTSAFCVKLGERRSPALSHSLIRIRVKQRRATPCKNLPLHFQAGVGMGERRDLSRLLFIRATRRLVVEGIACTGRVGW